MADRTTPFDWLAWHRDYEDPDSALSQRLAIIQRNIREFLMTFEGSPVRVLSMCAGKGADLLGAVASVDRRDIEGRLVELNPDLADVARHTASALGLERLEVVTGDAGTSAAYAGAVPADLVLEVGVFGNISADDIERTVRASPMLCAPGAMLIFTRHRGEPDQTPIIRGWYEECGFEEVSFESVPGHPSSVGVMAYRGEPVPFVESELFTFIRTG